jgi:hypothetical protein
MVKKGERLVRAKDVLKNPTLPDDLPGHHILLHDKSASTTFENQLRPRSTSSSRAAGRSSA